MSLNLDSIGKSIGPVIRSYDWKDVVLYALGVGCGYDHLAYCYEKDLKVLPGFSIAAIFDLFQEVQRTVNFNPKGIVHGEQELIMHEPIPTEGILITDAKITHCYDKGKDKGALIVVESDTFHSSGKKLFASVITLFSRLDGGFGGPNVSKIPVVFPETEPDAIMDDCPFPNQPLIYRLCSFRIQTLPVNAPENGASGSQRR